MNAPIYRLPIGSINIAKLKRKPWYIRLMFFWREGERSPFIPREKSCLLYTSPSPRDS